MVDNYNEAKVLAVSCPYCDAKPGDICRSRTGRKQPNLHTQRKGKVYPKFLKSASGGPKGGVAKEPPVPLDSLTDKQKRVMSGCMMNTSRSVEMSFSGEGDLSNWKPHIECLEMGLIEMFIGKSARGYACTRIRLTKKGKQIWNWAMGKSSE